MSDLPVEPLQPYHRWPSNEIIDRPTSARSDRCLACGIRRFSDEAPDLPNLPCPGHRIQAVRRDDVDVCEVCSGRLVVEAGGDYWRHA